MARGAGLVKWGVVPILAAFIGFRFIGPHYAGNPKLNKLVQEGKEVVRGHTPLREDRSPDDSRTEPKPRAVPDSDPKPAEAPAPRVSVEVKPVGADRPSEDAPKRRRRRRRRRHVEPSDEAPPETTNAPDRSGPDPASTP